MLDKASITQHISQQFNEELEELHSLVLTMGGVVEQHVSDAIEALLTGNAALGEAVALADYKVNAFEVDIDERTSHIIARRQPAAGDLRLLITVIKTITDLERIGDEAEKIGRIASALGGQSSANGYYADIRQLGENVSRMLHEALDAFARTDPEAAMEVARQDEEIDREYEALIRQLTNILSEDSRDNVRRVIDIMWCARALERIGDHAKNICEYVVFMVLGRDIRHTLP